ncbi:PLD nuclease N-terminal domain-containing protein [Paenibacillus septentrionalis]|uniref:PLD nuclease N-terminal domain-containing protein n=1 Tax=Paenibacillus septentrionalis TaxID=429342 RepID=A0ABW1V7H3_9BACL
MSELATIRWDLLLPVIVIQFILMLIAIIDLVRSQETRGPKWMWLVIILVSGMFGSIIYFIVGRKQS